MSQNDLIKKIKSTAINALIMEKSNNSKPTSFLKQAYNMVFINPDLLTMNWVSRINKWGDEVFSKYSFDEDKALFKNPGYYTGKCFRLKIVKKIRRNKRKHDTRYSKSMDYIGISPDGWRYWFRIHIDFKSLIKGYKKFPKKNEFVLLYDPIIRDKKTGISFISGFSKYSRILK